MRFLVGFVIGLVVLPLIGYGYVYLGLAPVATDAPPLPMERRLAHMALNARISQEAPAEAGLPATEENLMSGAKVYRENCAVCHGISGQPETPTAKGMFPDPPQLFPGKGVTDDPVGDTWWRVQNGIRLTGMPGYGGTLSPDQIWQVSLLLAKAHELPDSVTTFLNSPLPAE